MVAGGGGEQVKRRIYRKGEEEKRSFWRERSISCRFNIKGSRKLSVVGLKLKDQL